MKEVFRIVAYEKGESKLQDKNYAIYPEAQNQIMRLLQKQPTAAFQIIKVWVTNKETDKELAIKN